MTTRELQRLMDQLEQSASTSKEMQDLQRKIRGRPFYICSAEKRKLTENPNSEFYGRSDFNHIIGLPSKKGKPQPLWDY
jgi:hypothetical protein